MLESYMSLIVKDYLHCIIGLRFYSPRPMASEVDSTVVKVESVGFVESGNKLDCNEAM
jgi:hypothetical protein